MLLGFGLATLLLFGHLDGLHHHHHLGLSINHHRLRLHHHGLGHRVFAVAASSTGTAVTASVAGSAPSLALPLPRNRIAVLIEVNCSILIVVVNNICHLLSGLLVRVAATEPAAVKVVADTEANNGWDHTCQHDNVPKDLSASIGHSGGCVDTFFSLF